MRLILAITSVIFMVYSCGGLKHKSNPDHSENLTAEQRQKLIEKCTKIDVPNTFSPNADGVNDVFKIGTVCTLTKFKFNTFNRWGNEIYTAEDQSFSWDGSRNDNTTIVNEGTYYYTCSFQYLGEEYSYNGYIVVIK